MEKIQVNIQEVEEKKAKTGRSYLRVKTSEGWMSAFDMPVITKLKGLVGQMVWLGVNVDEEKGFKTIKNINSDYIPPEKQESPAQAKNGGSKGNPYAKDPVGLAVEVFIAIWDGAADMSVTDAMDKSIQIVKQAQKAFGGDEE